MKNLSLSENLVKYSGMPARVHKEVAAQMIGVTEDDIPVLVSKGLLKPLGKPVPNAAKYFATIHLQALAQDVSWLNKATQVLYDYWRDKNDRKKATVKPEEAKQEETSLAE